MKRIFIFTFLLLLAVRVVSAATVDTLAVHSPSMDRDIPVVAIAGAVEAADELLAQGFAAVFPIQAAPTSLPEAMETARAAENIRRTVKQIVNLLKSFGQ